MIRKILTAILLLPTLLYAQINTERVSDHCPQRIVFRGLRAFYSIFQSGNQHEALFIRALFLPCAGKINLDDFRESEADCDQAIQRNPFVVGAYQIRGLARIRRISSTVRSRTTRRL